MQYARIHGIQNPVSRIVCGTAGEPFASGAAAEEYLEEMLENGINTVDTARVYGESEEAIGRWLSRFGRREQVVLITKGGHFDLGTGRSRLNPREIREDLERSLENLRTDSVDFYFLHRDDPSVPVGELAEFLHGLYEEGKVRVFGGSNWSAARLQEAIAYAEEHGLCPMGASSPQFSLAVQQVEDLWNGGSRSLTGESHARERAWYKETQIPAFFFSSLAGGLLTGKVQYARREEMSRILTPLFVRGYGGEENLERLRRAEELAREKECSVSQLALAWVLCQGMNGFALCSSTHPGRILENAQAADLLLTEEESRYLNLEISCRR